MEIKGKKYCLFSGQRIIKIEKNTKKIKGWE
jgi:hypothetical protein